MKILSLTTIAIVLSCAVAPARAGDDTTITRLATCQNSWLDWQKSDPARLKKLGEYFGATFSHKDNDPFGIPKSNVPIAGLRITQAFPDSIGMAVGFSVTVDAPFDKARAAVEKIVGKKLAHCETGDNMKTCTLQIADQRTVTLMASDPPDKNGTLVGCYYFYEK
jgi:hypothetical protein